MVIRSMAPINLVVHYPKTEDGRNDLKKHVSDVHAASVVQKVKSLNCPASQKQKLLDAIIKTMRERSKQNP